MEIGKTYCTKCGQEVKLGFCPKCNPKVILKKYTLVEIRAMFEKFYDGDIRKWGNRYLTTGASHGFNYYLQAFDDLGLLEE